MSRKKLQKKFNINIISLIIGMILSASTSYVVAQTLVKSEDVYYDKTSSGLAVNNVQAAIDGTCTKFSNELTNFLNKIYPVGTIYTSTASTNPSSFLGGTWEAYGKGQTLVGIDSSQTEFNTVGKAGGSKSVTTTLSTKNLPTHTHTIPSLTGTTSNSGAHNHPLKLPHNQKTDFGNMTVPANSSYLIWGTGVDWTETEIKNFNNTNNLYSEVNGEHTHTISTTASNTTTCTNCNAEAFTTSTLQPYITVYMWRRTK